MVGQTFAMVKFGVIRHQPDSIIEILMSLFSPFEGKKSITSVEKSASVIGVQGKSFIILSQTLIIKIIVIQSKCLIVIVSGFARI